MATDSSTLQLYGKPIWQIDGTDDDLVYEQVIDFSGGEDDYRRSTLIGSNQCQKLVNIVVRDNYEAWTRPGADLFAVNVAAHPIKTLKYFDTPTNQFLLAICNGSLKACAGQNQSWQASTPAYTAANTDTAVEIEQGVDTCLISDGTNALAILAADLTLTTCTTGATDPPVGANILLWNSGRMFAAGFSGVGGAAVARDTIVYSTLLAFGNGAWNLSTRSFRIGNGDGDPITAMASMQDDVLAVFKANSVWLVHTDPSVDATAWQASNLIESLGFGVGCVGKRAFAAHGNDVFFMAQDGVRSVQRMQAAAAQWQLSAPISQPVQQYINRINKAAQSGIRASSYREFVFFAIPLDSSTVNNATLVYNTRLAAWLGCWTGWTPSAWAKSRFNSVEVFHFGDTSGNVSYWKDSADTNNASTYLDNNIAIPCTIWTRSFQFQQPVNDKTGYSAILRFTAGNATVQVSAMMDLAATRTWQSDSPAVGDVLGIGRLGPFQLATVKPSKVQKSLRGLPTFNEMYLAITTTTGFFKLRNVTVAAFLDAFKG